MRVLVCGSRTYNNAFAIEAMLQACVPDPMVSNETLTLINGNAAGADTIAKKWGIKRTYVETITFPAQWDKHGKAAGPIRNKQMLDEGKPDVVFAFVDKPLVESKGTAHMVKISREAGLPVYVIERLS